MLKSNSNKTIKFKVGNEHKKYFQRRYISGQQIHEKMFNMTSNQENRNQSLNSTLCLKTSDI